MSRSDGLYIGFGGANLTPDRPVMLAGQFHARVSEGVTNPITVTAMAFESIRDGRAEASGVMVSCDLVSIFDQVRDAMAEHLRRELPELDPSLVCLNATHTHTGPSAGSRNNATNGTVEGHWGVELDAMDSGQCAAFLGRRIADAVIAAWQHRRPASIGFGLGHATVGFNRRMCYLDGHTKMYGQTNDPQFSHIEGPADTAVDVVGVWDRSDQLLGVIVNLACPSQSREQEWKISADYWHETRQELRRRLGEGLFILPQCAPAGDVVSAKPMIDMDWRAQERMWRLSGMTQQQDIANRITDAVAGVLPLAHRDAQSNPIVRHRVETVELSRRFLERKDADDAQAEAEQYRKQYESLRRELEAHPEMKREPRWYQQITQAYRRIKWNEAVVHRYQQEKPGSKLPAPVHVLRFGDFVIATNPFEYYQDYGHRIRARSKAVQTMLVQLAGSGGYLATARANAGGSYGAIPASTVIGPEGGRELADWTVEAIDAMWEENAGREDMKT